jgi:hypothetical protein
MCEQGRASSDQGIRVGRSKFVSTREGDWLRLAPQANGAGLAGVWAL